MKLDNHIKLYIHKKLITLTELFYKTAKIDEIRNDEQKYIIKRDLPEIIRRGFQVWCRNGSVTPDAAPCSTLECRHKIGTNDKNDVSIGCSKCLKFQITSPGIDWNSAKHLYKFAAVELDNGR